MAKVALVLGGAKCLYEDFDDAISICQPHTIIATNNAGHDFPMELQHWVTLHTEKMPDWIEIRKKYGFPDAQNYWTSNRKTIPPEHKGMYKQVKSWDGSSGLLGITVALHLGYTKVILCGIPLEKSMAHYHCDQPWMDAPRYRAAWLKHMDEMQGKVKSFRGWTSVKLGVPTIGWVNDDITRRG